MTGPHRPGHVALDFSSFLATAGQNGSPDIPFDSLRVVLTRTADRTTALDTVFQVRGDTLSGDSIALRLNISLTQNSEQFNLVITTYGAGLPWYQASDTVTITAGATAAPALTARYVGRGANAARVQMLPADTTMFGGDSFPLHAVVYDSSSAVIDSVPVGYRTSDSLNTNISNSTYRSSLYAQPAQRDSVWVVAETPTHLRDSTRVHINPPAVAVAKDSGDGQSGSTGVALGQAFVVRVTDALSGPFQGRRVIWTITAGSGTLSSGTATDTTFTDSTGRARTTLTGSAPAAFSVSAASAGLAGSPQTFSATITNPVANTLTLVSGTAQVDTVGRALAAPFVVKATIGGVTPVAGAKIAWSTRTGGATRSSDTTLTAGNGQAQITVTLGTTAGTDTVRASLVGTAQFVDFAATALVSHPHLISIVSGDAQTDTAGRTLALPLVVLVTDSLLNPIAGTKVAWQVVYGLGTPTPDTVATDAGGHAQVSYKLGNTAGTDTVAAKLIANGVSVKFDETAVSGAIASVKVVPKIDTLPKGDSLQYSDTLKDSIGNVVGGAVTWSSTNPTVATVTAAGLARLLAAGQAGIIAAAAGHADTAQLFVRALTTIAVSPSDTVVTAVGDSLLLTARGVDNFGATVPGTVIRFSSASPSIATVNAITGRVHITGPGNAVLLA